MRIRTILATLLFALLATAAVGQSRLTVSSPQEPATLLPHFDLLTLTHEVQHLAFDCLWAIDAQGDYLPRLAAEVPTVANGGISEDGTTYTIRLRDGVTWQDGEPFTSEDVRYTWQVITNPDLPIPSRAVWQDIASIETPDATTAVVTFPETNVSFLGVASGDACFILPEHVLAGQNLVESDFNRDPVGTGPYTVEEWAAGSFLRLSANPDYWGGAPAIDEVVVQFPGGAQALRTSLQRGEADLALHLTSADVSFVRGLDAYALEQAPDHAWWQFWINNEHPILSERDVRIALEHGIDKALITETVMNDIVQPLDAMLPPSHWAHNPDVPAYPYDPERARALLDAAGWTDGDGDGVREKDGTPLELEILNIAGQAERQQVVQIAQDLWGEIGVRVTIREIDGASFPPTMSQGDFELAYGWFGENQEPVFSLWLGTNWQNYDNEEAFAILREVPETVSRDEREAMIRRFQEIVAADVPMIPLAPRPILNAVSDRLEGYAPTLSGSLWNAEEFSLR